MALVGVGQRDLYGAGGWEGPRGVAVLDVRNGGRSVSHPRGPKGYKRSDARIYEDVCETLAWAEEIDASDVEVSVVKGEVKLSGTVRDRRTKLVAEMLVDRVAGIGTSTTACAWLVERGRVAEVRLFLETGHPVIGQALDEMARYRAVRELS